MATVSELVDEVADVTGESRSRVNQLARNLIDNGILPKSRGRAIAHVEARHVMPLIAAAAFAPRNNLAGEVAHQATGIPIVPSGMEQGHLGSQLPYSRHDGRTFGDVCEEVFSLDGDFSDTRIEILCEQSGSLFAKIFGKSVNYENYDLDLVFERPDVQRPTFARGAVVYSDLVTVLRERISCTGAYEYPPIQPPSYDDDTESAIAMVKRYASGGFLRQTLPNLYVLSGDEKYLKSDLFEEEEDGDQGDDAPKPDQDGGDG